MKYEITQIQQIDLPNLIFLVLVVGISSISVSSLPTPPVRLPSSKLSSYSTSSTWTYL
ncbi:2967_t:CDS:2 [Entrophospora sp. SA101]|nr:2967_t:CDS:2 [Entrophospora sp. SA101]